MPRGCKRLCVDARGWWEPHCRIESGAEAFLVTFWCGKSSACWGGRPRGGGRLRLMYSMSRRGGCWPVLCLCFGDTFSLLILGSNDGLIVSCLSSLRWWFWSCGGGCNGV